MMAAHITKKPQFGADQITSASIASKKLAQLRTAAKSAPQYISANNKIDSVILDYAQYEKMYQQLELYRELAWRIEITERSAYADAHSEQMIPLQQAVGKENYARILAIDPDETPDEELFE